MPTPDNKLNSTTGVHPNNDYPLVDGQLDLAQEMKLQARQESEWARGERPDHPPFATKGPDRIALGRLADANNTATPGGQTEEPDVVA